MRAVRLSWTIGGLGLVLCGVIGMLGSAAPALLAGVGLATDLVYAAAVLVFAVGLSREASVVARRPLGLTALAVVALWPFAPRVVDALLPAPTMSFDPARSVLVNVDLFVSLAAALVAVVQIGRIGAVPHRWRWAPLWALAVSVATWVLPQIFFVAIGPTQSQEVLGLMTGLGTIGFLARTLGLGILALVLAAGDRRGSVEVYPSTSP